MRTIALIFLLTLLVSGSNIQAQKIYSSNQIKLIFSTAPNATRGEQNIASPMRFSAFFNYSIFLNVDLNKFMGFTIGAEVKNIGMILKDSIFRTKHRAYAVGIPVYLRFGNMDKRWYFLAGAQYDYQFAYKEKVFVNDSKTKRIGQYSHHVTPFMPSVFIGFRTKAGTSLGVHYMLDHFMSQDYRFKDPTQNNAEFKQGYDNTQLVYFTIGFMGDMDRKTQIRKKPKDSETQQAYYR